MSKKRGVSAERRPSVLAVSEWSLRRKVALALMIPMLLAAALGGLRVRTALTEAENYSATASQVTVLRPAVAYLAAAEHAVVVARKKTAVDDPDRDAAVKAVQAAGSELELARDAADLTPEQLEQVNSVLGLSTQLRDGKAYISIGASVSQVRQLHRGVTQLINTIINEQIEPEPRLQLLAQTLEGRLSLALQQLAVAYGDGASANPVELASELGVEGAAIERLGVALGATHQQVLALRQQNAQHFGTIRGGGTDLGGEDAYAAYDQLAGDLLDGIDRGLTQAAGESRNEAILNSAVTLAALLAAIILAFLVSRLLLNPIRRVREGALEVANEQLPEAVARIRAGGDPGEIVPIGVTTREEMGQLARAVDDLHRQAVRLASGEAKLRSQVGEMFVTLSRRNTSLINQQLGLIETLERDEEDPQRLESLFRLDHLASRMRRTAESLMILADAPTQSGDLGGLAVADALHAATAGVQDYQRVQILSVPTERLGGAAASDVVHLLTELVDNALGYSPPTAPVLVITTSSLAGTTIQISDAGLGIPEDALAGMNENLRSGGEVTPETARRMGLFVVSRLARRHGISVTLDHNDRGGTTATVLLPSSILSAPVRPDAPAVNPFSRAAEAAPATDGPALASAEPAESPADGGLDRIEAAINAVIGLPQRRPGAALAGTPAAPAPEGGSLLQRLSAREDRPPLELVQTPPAEPAEPAEPEPEPAEPVAVAVVAPAPVESVVTAPVVVEPVAVEPVAVEQASQPVPPAPASVDVVAQVPGFLDAETEVPDWGEDETPIFKKLRSNWLSAGGGSESPWASSEVEAGWEAADRVAATPAAQLSEAGLPMRRPGNRLVPGGVAPAPAAITRDPEAIRARLAAHAAGVSRGRSAAVNPVPADRT